MVTKKTRMCDTGTVYAAYIQGRLTLNF